MSNATVKLSRLSDLLDREFGPLATVKMMNLFITLAIMQDEKRGVPMAKFGKMTGLFSSTLTRNIQALSSRPIRKELDGLGLVDLLDDPEDGRAKLLFLTSRGRRLWEQMKIILEGD